VLLSIPVAILGAIGFQLLQWVLLGLVIVAGASIFLHILSAIGPKFFYLIADAMSYFMQRFVMPFHMCLCLNSKIFIDTVGVIEFVKIC
jgi:hypothetical protein